MKQQLIALLLLFALVFPMRALAAEYKGIGLIPGFPREDTPRSTDIFIHETKPSTTIDERVIVVNNTDEPANIALYATDAISSHDGSFACKQKSEDQTEVGSWVNFDTEEVFLEPNSQTPVLFSITIPDDIEVGEHNGCVLVQKITEESPSVNGITLHTRNGARIQLTIPGDIHATLSILSFTPIKRDDRGFNLNAIIHNEGNVSVHSGIDVTTTSIFGNEVNSQGGTYSVLKDQDAEFNFILPERFWGGFFQSTLVATYTAANSNDQRSIESHTGWFFMWPHWSVFFSFFVLLLIISLGIFRAVLYRRKRSTWKEYEVGPTDTLHSLSDRIDYSWKKIARVNSLKAPFDLPEGSTILLPELPQKKRSIQSRPKKRNKSRKPKKRIV